jgi:hypothetical protein
MAGRIPSQVPRLVRGSVVTDRRRCGKPTCRCAEAGAAGHESVVLSYSQGGRTHFLMLPAEQVAAVRAATERYRKQKAQLEAVANRGLAELVVALAPRSGRA